MDSAQVTYSHESIKQKTPIEDTKVDPSNFPSCVYAHETACADKDQKNESTMIACAQSNTPRLYYMQTACQGVLKRDSLGPSFTPAEPFDLLYMSDKATLLPIQMEAQIDRGFFEADSEWICYRRNYFQASVAFSLSQYDQLCFVKTAQGFLPVQHFLVGISAQVDGTNKEAEIIQQTVKRDKGPQFKPELIPIMPNGLLMSKRDSKSVATFVRLQFKKATANNGKRKATQQRFVCRVDLFAKTHDGSVSVAMCHSIPLIVRGRSPGHYSDENRPTSAPQEKDVYCHYQPTPYTHHPPPCYYDQKLPYGASQDWQRVRYNSASSGSSSATSPQEAYFPQA